MIRKECSTCPHHQSPDWCSRIAHGLSCIAAKPGEGVLISAELMAASVAATDGAPPAGALPTEAAARKARDTQVAGDHYKKMGVQVWDVVDTWPLEQRIGYYRGGALKYLMRMGSKDQNAQEIAKGKHYMEKLLEVLQSAA